MSDRAEDESDVNLDAVLSKLGGCGRHQIATVAMIALVYTTNSMYNVNYVFSVDNVGYRCKTPTCVSSDTSAPPSPLWRNKLQEPLKQCHPTTNCHHYNYSETGTCTEWEYELPNSFVAESLTKEDTRLITTWDSKYMYVTPLLIMTFELACEDWKSTLVGTAHNFGKMLGFLVQGQISDRFGRKTAVVVSGSTGAVIGLIKSFASNFWCYVTLEVLEGALGDALSPMFMLSVEIVEKKRAVLLQMILLNCYTGGLILMPFIAYMVPYWRNFLRVIYAPSLLILTYYLFLDESIRWLYSKGKKERAIKLIEKIAKRNNVKMDKMILDKLDYIDEQTNNREVSDWKLLMKTFKSRIMVQRFVVCMVWWLTITVINYGMMISSVLIAGNKYVNFALLMLMDIPANVFYWLVLAKYKRRMPLLVAFLVGGVFSILQPFVLRGDAWLGVALFLMFETFATFSCNIVNIYTTELFPTYTRNSMYNLCSAVGRVGSLLAPQTPLLMSIWSGLPTFLFGVTSILSGTLTLFMPETANGELPNTVSEAERIGRDPNTVSVLLNDEGKVENSLT